MEEFRIVLFLVGFFTFMAGVIGRSINKDWQFPPLKNHQRIVIGIIGFIIGVLAFYLPVPNGSPPTEVTAEPPTATPGLISRQVYTLVNENSDHCLGIESASHDSLARAVQYTCEGQKDHQWELEWVENKTYRLINKNSNYCLGVESASREVGAQVVQYDCKGVRYRDHYWKIVQVDNEIYKLINENSSYCLSVEAMSQRIRAMVVQNSCEGRRDQQWKFVRVVEE